MTFRGFGFAVVAAMTLSACTDNTPTSANDINAAVGRSVIVPAFTQSAQDASALAVTAKAACAEAPSASLDDVRAAWKKAFVSWQTASVFNFGALTEEQRQRVEFFPDERNLVEARVNDLLQRDPAPTVTDVNAASAPAQGFPALEYLLFTDRVDQTNGCAVVTAIADSLAARLSTISAGWPSYVEGTLATSEDDGLTLLVEAITREVVTVRDDELGTPLGNANGNAPQPQLSASPYAGIAIEAMRAELSSMAAIIGGAGSKGLANRIRENGAGTYADDVLALIEQTSAALNRLDEPFQEALVDGDGRAELYAVHDGVFRELRNRVQDLGGAVGVTPGFNASDGD